MKRGGRSTLAVLPAGLGGALLIGALFASPGVGALAGQEFSFDTNRPDGRGPAGVLADHLVPVGSFELSYNFSSIDSEGLLTGTLPVLLEDILELFTIVPATMETVSHSVNVAYGLNENASIMFFVPFLQTRMGHLMQDGNAFFTESSGLGDVRLHALFRLYDGGAVRAHIEGGLSLPTGAIDAQDATPNGPAQLPYAMQAGSGTFGLVPGFTVEVMNSVGVVGAQLRGMVHVGENDHGYRLGNRVMGTAWMAPRINEFMSLSARVLVENWDGVSGFDPGLDPNQPTTGSGFTGGMRVEIPFGINLMMADGPLQGHRLGLEASFPVHQDYDGLQLQRDWSLLVTWEKAF